MRLRGGTRKNKNKSYNSDDDEVRELSDPDISGTATHLPRSTYSSRYKRARRTDDLLLRSIPTQTEFMPVSYYVEPVAVASFTVPPSGASSSTVQQEVSSSSIAMSTLPDRTRSRAHTSRRHRYGSVLFPNTTVERFD